MVVLVIVLVSIVSALLCNIWWKFCQDAEKIPGPSAYPLIGNLLFLSTNLETLFSNLKALRPRYGQVVRFWGGPKLCVFLTNPNDIQEILGTTRFLNKDYYLAMSIKKIMGDGLLANREPVWKRHRKFITPAFHFKILKGYLEIFGRTSAALMERLDTVADGQTIDPVNHLLSATIESIKESAFGTDVEIEERGDVMALLKLGGQIMMKCNVRPWLIVDRIFKLTPEGKMFHQLRSELDNATSILINQKLKEFQSGGFKTKNSNVRPFVDIFIEESMKDGIVMPLCELQVELNHLMVAAVDTSAITLSSLLTLLGIYPHIQQEVINEAESIFGNDTRHPTSDDINKMDVLTRCLKETLRMFPTAPFIAREITEDAALPSGYTIPKSAGAVIFAYSVHRDPNNYPEPDRFWPDRWLPENSSGRHPYAFLPFGAGSRNCIGQKYAYLIMKTIASSIFRRFRVSTNSTLASMERLEAAPIVRPVDGFNIQLNRLKKSE